MRAITYLRPVDGHVHLRWEEYSDVTPSFAELAFRDAKKVGLAGIVEEPNTEPPLTDAVVVNRRKEFIDRIRRETGTEDIGHGIAMAITGDERQILGALDALEKDSRICSGKTFFSKSTKSGGIEILAHDAQKKSWEVLACSPKGAIVRECHLEDDDLFVIPFDPTRPETHALRQGPETEVIQFGRQLGFAYDAGFKGTLVVKHTSNPETIYLGEAFAKRFSPEFRIMYETTFHHMLLNVEYDYPLHGNLVKMNPSLRPKKMQEELLRLVIAGRTHLIGTDHAAHKYAQKIGAPYKSGIPAIYFWPKGIELLREAGLPEEDVRRLTFYTGNELYFGSRLKPRKVTVEYAPQLAKAYGFNPFSRIDGTRS